MSQRYVVGNTITDGINIRLFSDKFRILAHFGLPQATGWVMGCTSICLNINSIKSNPLVRYGGPGEGGKNRLK